MFNKKGFKLIFSIFTLLVVSLFLRGNVFASDPNFSLKILYVPQCGDGRDNDGDGHIDYPEDTDCTSLTDDEEDLHAKSGATSAMIVIQGKTIPNAKIKILKDGKIIIYSKSDNDGNFYQSLYGFYYGNYSFGLIAEAKDKTLTNITNFNLELKPGNYISVSDVFVAPTISIDSKSKIGEDIYIEGYGLSDSNIEIVLFDQKTKTEKILNKVKTNKNGYYSYQFDTKNSKEGDYLIYSKNILNNTVVGLSKSLELSLSKSNDTINNSENYKHKVRCDLNSDDGVNLIDFSILIFHWLSSNYKEGDFNADGIVDIKDFSIMAYNWTGD